jgi:hypothetical protein
MRCRRNDAPAAPAILVQRSGSAPQQVGSKMVVNGDGGLPDMDTVAGCPKACEIGARNGDWPSKGERDS